MRHLLVLLFVLPLYATDQPCGSTIFIAPMDGGLDGYIRARMVEQAIPIQIVMEKDKADFVMSGSAQQSQDHWYAATTDKNTGEVTIIDKNGTFVWSAAAGDRNIWWGRLAKHGPEKVAERIVDKLKSYKFQSCPAKKD
jgi:hypothetical protein